MNTYEKLLMETYEEGIIVDDMAKLKENESGYYISYENLNAILINKGLDTTVAKRCTLGEELGHHNNTSGDITDQTKIENVKQERKARVWGYERLVPIPLLAEAINYPCQNKTELAEYLEVTEEFLLEALSYYKAKHGEFCRFNKYTVYFEPLKILKMF